MELDRFEKQIQFIIEIDKLKHVLRQTILMDRSRRENSVEHSWHIALMALLLSEYAEKKNIDLLRVIKMLLIHDLVEIDAGDTFCYDNQECKHQFEREKKAAGRIFNILPQDQAKDLRDLWEEFETRNSPESIFAAALDRLHPILHNYNTGGDRWKKNGVKSSQVLARNHIMKKSSSFLWKYTVDLIEDAVNKGLLSK